MSTDGLAKRPLYDDGSDTFDDIPASKKQKKNRPTAGSLPYYRRLIVDAGKRNLCVHMVNRKAWLAGQDLDTALTKAWLDAFDGLKDNLSLDPNLEPEDDDLAVVRVSLPLA